MESSASQNQNYTDINAKSNKTVYSYSSNEILLIKDMYCSSSAELLYEIKKRTRRENGLDSIMNPTSLSLLLNPSLHGNLPKASIIFSHSDFHTDRVIPEIDTTDRGSKPWDLSTSRSKFVKYSTSSKLIFSLYILNIYLLLINFRLSLPYSLRI